jgi:iron complex outermembrane receptor protein
MRFFLFCFLFFIGIANASELDALLDAYEKESEKSLKSVDEKLGHVFIYSQEDIRLMQYQRLGDILKELPLINYNTNRFGTPSLSLAGSKTTVSGFFRFFLNDQEISSAYTQSPFLNWGDLPLDFVESVEVYYGDSSFALGNDTGIYFIRIYTKKAHKENGGELVGRVLSTGSNSQSLLHSFTLENGWSYMAFFNRDKICWDQDYKDKTLHNDSTRRYAYLDLSKENTSIRLGYSDLKKEPYMGFALDVAPDEGEFRSRDAFINISHALLEDGSLKTRFSYSRNDLKYEEQNPEGIGLLPVIDWSSPPTTIPKVFGEDITFSKLDAYVAKEFSLSSHAILAALNFSQKTYDLKTRQNTNFLNQTTYDTRYHDFDKERVYSFLLQDAYALRDDLTLVANAKIDRYERDGFLEDSTEYLLRAGGIYTPNELLGFKTFYTQTYIPPSFFNIDMADANHKQMESQKYKFFTFEGVAAVENSKLSLLYNRGTIDDFVYFTPVGFINIGWQIRVQSLTLQYEHKFTPSDTFKMNYYVTKLSETINNSDRGGMAKYMGSYGDFSYFTSLIYRNGFSYYEAKADDSFDLSLGLGYSPTKDLQLQLKGENLLDDGRMSVFQAGIGGENFTLNDDERRVSLSAKWVF